MPTTLVLVRHGETDWNRDQRFQGHADPPLNENGRRQALTLASELGGEPFVAAYASPLRRAYETGRILADALGLELTTDDRLEEVDVGSWSGLTRSDVEARFPDGFRRWLAHGHGWDDGESYDELGARVVSGLTAIANAHPAGSVLVVTHGGPIRSALASARDIPFGEARDTIEVIGNCAVVRLAAHGAGLERLDASSPEGPR